jgi:hypothetical protein
MSAAADLLHRLAEVGAKVEASGNRLIVRAGPKPVPGELVQRLREAKAEVLVALAPAERTPAAVEAFYRCNPSEAAQWRRHFIIRTIDRELRGARFHAEAARLAWGELLSEWHKRHGRRWPASQCAGCGRPLGGIRALGLADGSRLHLDKLDCLLSFGERWRNEATAGLRALGLDPPAGAVPL